MEGLSVSQTIGFTDEEGNGGGEEIVGSRSSSQARSGDAGQEATVRTGHGTTDWFQIGKGVHQGCILSPCYLTYIPSTS